jgi:hypothetical protein
MAELAIKVGSVSADPRHYQDGDILAAFNSRAIRCVHAQHICHVKNAGGGRGVPRDTGHVANDFFAATHQYRFDRVDRTTIRRVLLSDMSEVLIDGTPRRIDGKSQHMDVELYVQRRLAHENHKIFGTEGREFWYGGRTDLSDAALTTVWTAIEAKTAHREVDFPNWPAGIADLKSHLFVPIDNFTDAVASDLVSPELDETDPDDPVTIRKRRRFVDWRASVPARDHDNVENRGRSVDLRPTLPPLARATAVQTRPPGP